MLDVSQAIGCLYRISMDLRNGPTTDRYAKSANIDTSFYEPYDLEYVRQKFPAARDFLVARLGKAISKRRQYFKYQERHAAKLAQFLDVQDTATVLSETTASTAGATEKLPLSTSSFTSDGLDVERRKSLASIASETSYATSAGNENRVRMPSMPKDAASGQPFECPYCHKIDSVSNTHAWMRHVYKDLQPYVCTFEQCTVSEETYENR